MSNKDLLDNIKKLREMTGVGFKDCKKALDETKGDIDKSIEIFLQACEDNDIEPMTTIFTRDVIKKTFSQGFKNIKLASFDCISY